MSNKPLECLIDGKQVDVEFKTIRHKAKRWIKLPDWLRFLPFFWVWKEITIASFQSPIPSGKTVYLKYETNHD